MKDYTRFTTALKTFKKERFQTYTSIKISKQSRETFFGSFHLEFKFVGSSIPFYLSK
jgi:hypothetical protein